MPSPKHRAPVQAVVRGWTRWPRHRDDSKGPAESDGMVEILAAHPELADSFPMANALATAATWSA